jgi:UDPglucose 6-dehydrogenase
MTKLSIIGTGYVGLVTGACLAEVGNQVMCLDVDPAKIALLNSGHIPIFEPGLEDMVKRNVAAGRLTFTTDVAQSTAHGEIQFIAVGTPSGEDGSADLRYVLAAVKSIAVHMQSDKVIVNKSTVPVGTADKARQAIQEVLCQRGVSLKFDVVSNPEFLKEGAAIEDFMRPDRIIIGVDSERVTALMRKLYAPFQRNHDRIIIMDVRSAELTKYAANAMLATRISFMNELANLAEVVEADIELVRKGIGSDPRIGYDFLYSGCGYGGSCFPKDVKALIQLAAESDSALQVLKAVESANNRQKTRLLDKVMRYFKNAMAGKHFALWGLAFKPNTDDMREAPSLEVIDGLLQQGATVCAYDPVAMQEAKGILGDSIDYAISPQSALKGADALIIVTEWKEFRSPDFSFIKEQLRFPIIFDGRNLYDPTTIAEFGIQYEAIGRGKKGQ